MRTETEEIRDNLKYLSLLARDYPSQAAAASEIISTQALLKLPKGTEHFMSDLHGENEAFVHILNSASGVIREKVDIVLGDAVPEDTRAAGRAAVKSFGVKSRFVHFEFFRMTEDQASMGKKGQLVALEVNMRPCGGFTPDMINFARSTNVYKIWADMIAFGGTDMPVGEHYYCPFAGRRDGKNFVYSHEQIMQKYQKNMRMVDRIPEALSGAMGNQMYVATFSTREEMEQFYSDVLAVNDPVNAKVQKELAEVLALGEPTTTALTEKPNLSPAVKPTTAVTKTPTRAVTKTARKRK